VDATCATICTIAGFNVTGNGRFISHYFVGAPNALVENKGLAGTTAPKSPKTANRPWKLGQQVERAFKFVAMKEQIPA
jgi:hypothetical protein